MIPFGTNLQLRSVPAVTISLIVISTICFFIWNPVPFEELTPSALYWESFFSVFIHLDIFHLLFNMLFLWVFGRFLEDKIGSKKFLLYYFICEIGASLLHNLVDGRPAVGASGAIAGVMGIYLYRCHYSKVKAIVSFLIVVFQVNINAKWLLLVWVIRDIYAEFYTVDNVAHWAHIGGFFTGIIIGKINNYWKEGEVEHLYERASESLHNRWGLTEAEDDLLKVLKIDPYNAEANLELARYFSEHDEKKERGKKYYLAAARAHYIKNNNKTAAGEIFLEYLDRYEENMPPVLHLKYANALSDAFNYQGASTILEPLIDADAPQEAIGEKVFLSYINFSLKAGLDEPARYAHERFRERYPDSPYIKKTESLIRSYKPKNKRKVEIIKATSPSKTDSLIEEIKEIGSDWVFKILIIASFCLLAFFNNLVDVSLLFPLAIVLSFIMTYVVRRQSTFLGSIYAGRNAPEDERLREYNVNTFMNKAAVCEREENYDDAIEYLKAVIEEERDIENLLELRYRIAKIYHKKLNQPLKAINEYKILSNIAPEDHPFKRDAYEEIKELSKLNPSPAV